MYPNMTGATGYVQPIITDAVPLPSNAGTAAYTCIDTHSHQDSLHVTYVIIAFVLVAYILLICCT